MTKPTWTFQAVSDDVQAVDITGPRQADGALPEACADFYNEDHAAAFLAWATEKTLHGDLTVHPATAGEASRLLAELIEPGSTRGDIAIISEWVGAQRPATEKDTAAEVPDESRRATFHVDVVPHEPAEFVVLRLACTTLDGLPIPVARRIVGYLAARYEGRA